MVADVAFAMPIEVDIPCVNMDDIVDTSYVVAVNVLTDEGRLFITGPPLAASVDSESSQFVPPRPSVIKTLPDDIKRPVFESTAYTL
jgi:hypothetical protein